MPKKIHLEFATCHSNVRIKAFQRRIFLQLNLKGKGEVVNIVKWHRYKSNRIGVNSVAVVI